MILNPNKEYFFFFLSSDAIIRIPQTKVVKNGNCRDPLEKLLKRSPLGPLSVVTIRCMWDRGIARAHRISWNETLDAHVIQQKKKEKKKGLPLSRYKSTFFNN